MMAALSLGPCFEQGEGGDIDDDELVGYSIPSLLLADEDDGSVSSERLGSQWCAGGTADGPSLSNRYSKSSSAVHWHCCQEFVYITPAMLTNWSRDGRYF